jgi:hypothetical protein
MKITAELSLLSNGHKYPNLSAIQENGRVCESITMTLLDFVSELHQPANGQFETLLAAVEAGGYMPKDPAKADFSVNDKLVWVRPPEADPGSLRISNENVPEFSVDGGHPQSFSIALFRSTNMFWQDFLLRVNEDGEEAWLGKTMVLNID